MRRGNEAIRVTVKRDNDERTDEESGRRGAALRLETLRVTREERIRRFYRCSPVYLGQIKTT